MNRQKKQWEIRMTVLLTVLCLLLLGLFSWFMATRGDSILTSDESSELVLAELLHREHRIITTSWFYSSELRLLNTQLVFAPLFAVFDDWGTVRIVGSTLLLAILALSALLFARAVKLGTVNALVCALLMLVPFSGEYFSFVMVHSYYVPHITISYVTMAALFAASEKYSKGERRAAIWMLDGFAAILGAVTCMGGIRQLLVLYFPLLLTGFIMLTAQLRREYDGKRAPETERSFVRHFFAGSTFITLFAGLGYVFNTAYLGERYLFASWNNIHFVSFSAERFSNVLNGIAASLGYRTGERVFSVGLLMNAAFLGFVVLLIAALIDSFQNHQTPVPERALSIFFLAGLGLYTAVCTFTDFDLYDRYSLPIVVFAFSIVLMYIRRALTVKEQRQWRALAAAGLVLFCLPHLLNYAMHRYCRPNPYQAVADTVLENGCRYGYSSFWNGNILTELSDGQIEMHNWGIDISSVDDVNIASGWLQKTSHVNEIPVGPIFCLFSNSERNTPLARQMEGAEVIYETDQFVVYRFSSYQAMIEHIAVHRGG